MTVNTNHIGIAEERASRGRQLRNHLRLAHELDTIEPIHLPPQWDGIDPVTDAGVAASGWHGYRAPLPAAERRPALNWRAKPTPSGDKTVWMLVQNQHRGYSTDVMYADPSREGVVP